MNRMPHDIRIKARYKPTYLRGARNSALSQGRAFYEVAAVQTRYLTGREYMRDALLKKFLDKSQQGLEIAPYHQPIVKKKDGYNIRTLDYLSTPELLERAKTDPNVLPYIEQIEEVDIVSSATELGNIIVKRNEVGSYDYVISSHNFEHLPNPIKFLDGCRLALKKDGMLTMAIPDKRYTFDKIRSLTRTADLIRSYKLNRMNHDPFDIFDFRSNFIQTEGDSIEFENNLMRMYEHLVIDEKNVDLPYTDIHASVFTKESFWLIMTELALLQLSPFVILEIHSNGCEFIVHMQNNGMIEPGTDTYLTLLKTRKELAQVQIPK